MNVLNQKFDIKRFWQQPQKGIRETHKAQKDSGLFLFVCVLVVAANLLFGAGFVISQTLAAPQGGAVEGKVTVRGFTDIGDAVVYIDQIPGKRFSPPSAPVVLDQKNLRFVPHVLPVLVGTKVAFPNSDEIRHNVFSPTSGSKFNLGAYPRNETAYYVFEKPGPVALLCNIHTEMSAYVVVVETPYFTTTDRAGVFSIPNVPPGKYTLRFWHERTKPGQTPIEVRAGEKLSITFQLTK